MRLAITYLRCAALMLLSTTVLSSCINTGDVFPSHWPSPRAGASCADIVGTYADEGEQDPNSLESDGPRGKPRLSTYLFERQYRWYDKAEITEISRAGGLYRVRVLNGDQVLSEAQFEEAQLSCSDGWLTLRSFSGLNSEGQTAGYDDWAIMLHIADDGSLLLRSRSSFTGVAIIIPLHGRGVTYARFERRQRAIGKYK